MDIRTQIHLTALRDLLTYREQELRADVHAVDFGQAPADPRTQRERDELSRVEAALLRLDHGSYGDCIACRHPIPLQRLLVQPAVERCAACQAVRENALRPAPWNGAA